MSGAMELPRLQLRRNEDRRIRQGHNWVYSNEIDTAATPLKAFTPGAQALLFAASGRPLGVVAVNPHSLICARLLVREGNAAVGEAFLRDRLRTALALREQLFAEPFYRLAYGDSDGLSGLVIDRYGDYLVVQIGTAGMEVLLDTLVAVLVEVMAPAGILSKSFPNFSFIFAARTNTCSTSVPNLAISGATLPLLIIWPMVLPTMAAVMEARPRQTALI